MSVQPFEKLEELFSFEIFEPPITKLRRKKVYSQVRSKVLLCHDMMGGYLDDKFIEGTNNSDAYRFFHWSKLDTFVYFSHNFITIPPYGWIHAGHKHGVKVLGTIITEWENGKKLCKELLQSEKNVDLFCSKICEITKAYGFDGWLLNIENEIEGSDIKMLEYLAKTLTSKMHKEVPESEVIWYDSVICTGELKWQDQLNCLNSKFFDITDGIFLNYNWSEEKLISTRDCAQERFRDVYIGIDVFGRGNKQLEGLECHKIIQEACDSKMSLAIFAPGWVYEVLGKEDFTINECKFWSLLGELLPSKAYCEIPFKTSFCQGFGLKKYHKGKISDEKPWHNLCLQEIQPSFSDKSVYKGMEFCLTDSFNGGSCPRFHGELYRNEFIPQNSKDFGVFLLKMEVPLDQRELTVSYVYKIEIGQVKVGIVLETNENLPNLLLTNVGEEFNFGDMCLTINPDYDNVEISKNGIDLSGTKEAVPWITRNYTIKEVNGKRMKTLELKGMHIRVFSKNDQVNSNFSVLLGEVNIS